MNAEKENDEECLLSKDATNASSASDTMSAAHDIAPTNVPDGSYANVISPIEPVTIPSATCTERLDSNSSSSSEAFQSGHEVSAPDLLKKDVDIKTTETMSSSSPGTQRSNKCEDNDRSRNISSSSISHNSGGLCRTESPSLITATTPTTAATAAAVATADTYSTGVMPSSSKPILKNRMSHLHKLEKKHSSGDLLSRLKTRKILGVGETDDGDVHRSKLSQILGHSEQLYLQLPYGLRFWQFSLAVMFSLMGLWALIFPSHLLLSTFDQLTTDVLAMAVRLYGGTLLSLSVMYWGTLDSQDRFTIRMTLLISILYFILQFIVTGWYLLMVMTLHTMTLTFMASRGIFSIISWYYTYQLTYRRWNGQCDPRRAKHRPRES